MKPNTQYGLTFVLSSIGATALVTWLTYRTVELVMQCTAEPELSAKAAAFVMGCFLFVALLLNSIYWTAQIAIKQLELGVVRKQYPDMSSVEKAEQVAKYEGIRKNAAATNTWVWLMAPNKKYGVANPWPVKIDKLQRLGFHLTVMKGEFTHRYLVLDWHILTRPDMDKMCEALEKAQMGKWRNPDFHQVGFLLNNTGTDQFTALSKQYSTISPEEWQAIKVLATGLSVRKYIQQVYEVREITQPLPSQRQK